MFLCFCFHQNTCKSKMNNLKNKSICEPIHFKIFTFFCLWTNKKRKNLYAHIYIYICMCVCVCEFYLKLAIQSIVCSSTFFIQKTISMTFYTNRCVRNLFFTEESVCLFPMNSFFSIIHSCKPMFSPFLCPTYEKLVRQTGLFSLG